MKISFIFYLFFIVTSLAQFHTKSTLQQATLVNKETLTIRGDILDSVDCRKISSLDLVTNLTLGGRIEGVVLPEGGLAKILEESNVTRLELYSVTIPEIQAVKNKKITELIIGGGPFVYGKSVANIQGVEEYRSMLTVDVMTKLFSVKALDYLTIDAPRENLDIDLLEKTIGSKKLKELKIVCKSFSGNLSGFTSRVKIKKLIIVDLSSEVVARSTVR